MAWSDTRAQQGGYLHPKKVARILAQHDYMCHQCGHGGATELDHIVPWAEWTHSTMSVHDQSNLAPIHGSACAVCRIECHAIKTKAEAARGRERGRAKRKSASLRPVKKHPGELT